MQMHGTCFMIIGSHLLSAGMIAVLIICRCCVWHFGFFFFDPSACWIDFGTHIQFFFTAALL